MQSKTGKVKIAVDHGQRQTQPASSLQERLIQLGIPERDLTDAVSLAISALLEKTDDMARELESQQLRIVQLERDAELDAVSNIPNRLAFMRRLKWALSVRNRYGHPGALLYFDLNGFKEINDRHGHAAGDAAILHVGTLLTASLRESDFVARLGGDEFAVLLPHASLEAARERGRQLSARIRETPLAWEGKTIPLLSAFGAYEIDGSELADEALARADLAMYENKRRLKTGALS
jgi:diguanylate cyclase (GGDEF)-like protein